MSARILLAAGLLVSCCNFSPAAHAAPATASKPKPQQLQLKERPLPDVSPEEALRLVGGPTLVTLDVEQGNASDVFASLGKQSGLTFVPQNNSPQFWEQDWPKITLHAKDEPFWKVMQRLSIQANFQLNRNRDWFSPSHVEVVRYGERVRPWLSGDDQQSPPFWVLASQAGTNFSSSRELGTSRAPHQDVSQLAYFSLYSDPHLIPIIMPGTGKFWFDEVTNEKRRAVSDKLNERQDVPNIEGLRLDALLIWSSKSASKTLQRVRGRVSTLLALKRQQWEVPINLLPDGKVAAPVQQTFETTQGQLTYLVEVAQVGTRWQLKVSWPASSEWLAPPYAIWRALGIANIQAFDEKGEALVLASDGGDPSTTRYTIHRSNPTDPYQSTPALPSKIVLNVPTDVRRLTVPYEFRDLPLPSL